MTTCRPTTRRPTIAARTVVGFTVRWLDLDDRIRYREELTAELTDLRRTKQLRHALSVLRGAYAPRRALAHGDERTSVLTAQDWRCRLHWHRFMARSDPYSPSESTYTAVHYLECARCGLYSTVAVRRRNAIIAIVLALILVWVVLPVMVAILLSIAGGAYIASTFAGDVMQTQIHGPGHQYRESKHNRR